MAAIEVIDLLSDFDPALPSVMDDPHLARMVFRSVTSGICIADATLRDMPIVYVNPAFERMTGYTLQEVLGKNCRILQTSQTEQSDQNVRATIRQAIRERREVFTIMKNFRKDGTPFWNELYLSPIRNAQNRVTHFFGIQSDVTARIDFESALRESEKLAAVGRLASSIAHEINNPLESVMNLIYLAQRTECSEETQNYLAVADQEMQRVKLIASQSLRFYKQSTKPQRIGCSDLLGPVLAFHQSRLTDARITLERRERSGFSVVCMESEIRQVLNNLVGNAIDAMLGSGGRLLIRTRDVIHHRSGAPGVLLSIADTGHGIDPDSLQHIYKAFFTTKGTEGTGLGLWISSEIIQRHHGTMAVRSFQRPNQSGTVFELFLPLQGLAAVN
jgi:PAS domain S-box-containing protein